MAHPRPYVFIGSSTLGLPVAEAIQANLDYDCECHIWHQGLFGLSGGTLETLVASLDRFDFAILACTPDDIVISGKETRQMPRDNVLLELGLFIGGIGRNRVFMVVNRDAAMKIPTDLAGITPATFTPPSEGNLQSALGKACSEIKAQVKALGKRKRGHRNLSVSVSESGDVQRRTRDLITLGLCIEIINCDSMPLPPHRLLLMQYGRVRHNVTLDCEKSGEMLPTQKRRFTIPILERRDGKHSPHPMTKMLFGQSGSVPWTLQMILEDSDTILYEDSQLGEAIGKYITRAIELESIENLEENIRNAIYELSSKK